MTDLSNTPSLLTQGKTRKPSGLSTLFLIVLGTLSISIGLVAAHGTGISPANYFVAGILIMPIAITLASRLSGGNRIVEGSVLLLGAITGFVTAYNSSRPPSYEVLRHLFENPQSSEVRDLDTRLEWSDGRNWFASFSMDQRPFDKMMDESKLELYRTIPDESGRDCTIPWYIEIGHLSAAAYDVFPPEPNLTSISIYKREFSGGKISLIRDNLNGRVWAIRRD